MPEYVRVKSTDTGAVYSQPVGASLDGVKVVDAPAVDDGGAVLPPEFPESATREDDGVLRGQALDDALNDAGLSKSGTADEKRARYDDHLAEQGG